MSLIPARRLTTLCLVSLSAAVLLASASIGRANTMTYNVSSLGNPSAVVYPDENNNSLTDTLSGTITVSSATTNIFNTWNSGDAAAANAITLSYDLSISNSSAAVSNIIGSENLGTLASDGRIQGGGLTITPTGMFMPNPNTSGSQVDLEDDGAAPPFPVVSMDWNGNFVGFGKLANVDAANPFILAEPSSNPSVFTLYSSGDTWQIATAVPEPGTLVLFVLGSVAIVPWARRRFRR